MRAMVLVPVLCGIALTAGGGVEIVSSARGNYVTVLPLSGPALTDGSVTELPGPWSALSHVQFSDAAPDNRVDVYHESDVGQSTFWGHGTASAAVVDDTPVLVYVSTGLGVTFVVTSPTTVHLAGFVDQGPASDLTHLALERSDTLIWDAGFSTPPGPFDTTLDLPVGTYRFAAAAEVVLPYGAAFNSGEWSVHFSVVPEPAAACLLSALGVLSWRRRWC